MPTIQKEGREGQDDTALRARLDLKRAVFTLATAATILAAGYAVSDKMQSWWLIRQDRQEQGGSQKNLDRGRALLEEVNRYTFEKEVIKSSRPVVVEIYSRSAKDQVSFESKVEGAAKDLNRIVKFVKIDWDSNAEFLKNYDEDITMLPSVLIVVNGERRMLIRGGLPSKEFLEYYIARLYYRPEPIKPRFPLQDQITRKI